MRGRPTGPGGGGAGAVVGRGAGAPVAVWVCSSVISPAPLLLPVVLFLVALPVTWAPAWASGDWAGADWALAGQEKHTKTSGNTANTRQPRFIQTNLSLDQG